MSFATPWLLAGLLVLPLLIGLYVAAQQRPGRYVVRLPGTEALAAALPAPSPWRHAPAALFALALAALLVALARPETTVAVPVEQASIVLVTDASGSMSASDVVPSRIDAARDAAAAFLDDVPEELRVGVVGFSDAPRTILPPTQDRDSARETLLGLIADGGTATGDALNAALDTLESQAEAAGVAGAPPAAIILLSDGKRTVGSDPVLAARRAKKLNIAVFTVALGTFDGIIETPQGPIAVPPDPATLAEVARVSGGRAYEITDADALQDVYSQVGSEIGTEDETREVTAGFAAGGLLLLLAAGGLRLRRGSGLL